MNKHGNIKCAGCGSFNIRMHVYFDGADWDAEAGEGSGFDYEVSLICEDCGRGYPVCRLNNERAVCAIKDGDVHE